MCTWRHSHPFLFEARGWVRGGQIIGKREPGMSLDKREYTLEISFQKFLKQLKMTFLRLTNSPQSVFTFCYFLLIFNATQIKLWYFFPNYINIRTVYINIYLHWSINKCCSPKRPDDVIPSRLKLNL